MQPYLLCNCRTNAANAVIMGELTRLALIHGRPSKTVLQGDLSRCGLTTRRQEHYRATFYVMQDGAWKRSSRAAAEAALGKEQ
jgi:hypothetical protein